MVQLGNIVTSNDHIVVQHRAVVFRCLVQVDPDTRIRVARLWLRSTKPIMNACSKSSAVLTVKGKDKVFPYSIPSVGPGADPGVQAVSPQVT